MLYEVITDDQLRAREPLAEIVVRIAIDLEGDAVGREGAEALAAGAVPVDGDGVLGQARNNFV